MIEHVLQDSPHRRIVRVGDTVRRPVQPWSGSIHALLLHLEKEGYPYSPRFLGIDGEGREILSFIPGTAGADGYIPAVDRGADAWAMVVAESGLRRFTRFLREYHDAVDSFMPASRTVWVEGTGPAPPGQTLCHGDFGPWNVVWRSGFPVGLIDWDYAYPGPALDDIAYMLEFCAPFRPDEECLRWLRYEAPPDRRRRLEVVLAAYGGLDDLPVEAVVDRVIDRQERTLRRVERLAGQGRQPQASWVAEGQLDRLRQAIRWSRQHRDLFVGQGGTPSAVRASRPRGRPEES